MRLFVAVDPGAEIVERIGAAVVTARGIAPKARWAPIAGLHVTLVFLGEVPDEQAGEVIARTREVASKHAPMTLRFGGASCFGGRKMRVLWAGIEGEIEALRAMQKELSLSLVGFGQGLEDRPYTPHLTLARSATASGEPAFDGVVTALAGQVFGEVRVGEVVVYRSDSKTGGSEYTAIARVPLGG
jgi:RNA 2',3'-cyclic 3'-phosphodiesterase